MTQPRFSLARRKARELLRQAHVRSVPVPVERVATLLGAKIYYEPFDGQISGLMRRRGKGHTIIGINSSHPASRQRFSIAHELGHVVLHRDEQFHVDEKPPIRFRNQESSLATNSDEIEANQFASELLMPKNLVMREIDKLPDDMDPEDAIRLLADRFQVSEQAMTLRLNRLQVVD